MRKRKGVQVLVGLLLVAALVLTPMACKAPEAPPVEAPPVAPPVEAPPVEAPPEEVVPPEVVELPPAGWSLALGDIPEIENKTPIHVGLLAGAVPEKILEFIDRFASHTGVPVTHEFISTTVMYPKVNLELLGRTGTYDVINPESTCINEWAEYLFTMEELAERYEPGGYERLKIDMAGHHPALLRTACDKYGNLVALPFYYYTQCFQYRQDVYENPTEMANFKAKYGYDLAPPTTYELVYDVGEFFTREAGDKLKGETLDHNIYGLSIMAGRFEINDEIFSMMGAKDATWARLIRDTEGNPKEFVITLKDMKIMKECLDLYITYLPFTPPGTLACFYDLPPEQMALGNAMLLPSLWGELAPWAMQVEDNVPGAKLALTTVPGKRPYFGAFSCSVPEDAKNPEAAYWFSRYMSSHECQLEAAEAGWNTCRESVMSMPKFREEKWRRMGIGSAIAVPVLAQWDVQEDYVGDILNWNSNAAGKIYEEQIIMIHDAAAGAVTPMRCIKDMVNMTVDFQNAFGELPIRVEPELAAWLGL